MNNDNVTRSEDNNFKKGGLLSSCYSLINTSHNCNGKQVELTLLITY